jgi:hypothetical protein
LAQNYPNICGILITEGPWCSPFSSLLLHFRFFGNVTLILFGSARTREIEKELQQNARGLDVMCSEDAQSETLQRKFVITIVGTAPRSVLLWVCGQRVMRILP